MTATSDDLTEQLEADYRRLLRWYPGGWRRAHGDALVGTLMDHADAEDRFLVERGEWRSFAAAGVTARLDQVVMRSVRDAASTIALALGLSASIIFFVLSSWQPWEFDEPRSLGPFFDAGPILTAFWVIATIAAWAGRWWIGRIALLLSAVAAFSLEPLQEAIAPPHAFSLDAATVTFSAAYALLAVLGTPRATRRLVGASLACVALTVGAFAATWAQTSNGAPLDWSFTSPIQAFYGSEYPAVLVLLALATAVVLAIARLWTAAFTVLLCTVPFVAVLDVAAASWLNTLIHRTVNPWAITLATVVGLVALVLASRGSLRLPTRRARDGASPIS